MDEIPTIIDQIDIAAEFWAQKIHCWKLLRLGPSSLWDLGLECRWLKPKVCGSLLFIHQCPGAQIACESLWILDRRKLYCHGIHPGSDATRGIEWSEPDLKTWDCWAAPKLHETCTRSWTAKLRGFIYYASSSLVRYKSQSYSWRLPAPKNYGWRSSAEARSQ